MLDDKTPADPAGSGALDVLYAADIARPQRARRFPDEQVANLTMAAPSTLAGAAGQAGTRDAAMG